MATTTFAAIRDKQRQIIEALTPTVRSDVRFEIAEDAQEFKEWCLSNPASAFRRFTINNDFEYEPPEVANHDVFFQRMRAEIVMAYPLSLGDYGDENIRDMQDLIDEDWRIIDKNIGPIGASLGNWVDGESLCSMTSLQTLRIDDIAFLIMGYSVGFYRAV